MILILLPSYSACAFPLDGKMSTVVRGSRMSRVSDASRPSRFFYRFLLIDADTTLSVRRSSCTN